MSSRDVCHSPRHRRRSSRRRRRKGCASHRHRRSSCKRHRRGSRRRGPITRNTFLNNYLCRFRKKHCNWHVTKITVEGAKCWCKMSSREKEKYYAEECKSKRSRPRRRSRRGRRSSCRSSRHRRSGSRRKLHKRSSSRMKRHGRRGGRRRRRMSKCAV
nr:unnamed protein product [Callosobruchus chinensis]CAH7727240.1 unnamed protein product [Callosobruchus chinensis]